MYILDVLESLNPLAQGYFLLHFPSNEQPQTGSEYQQNNNTRCKILHLPNEILIMILQLGEEIKLQHTTVFTMFSTIFVHSLCILLFQYQLHSLLSGPGLPGSPCEGGE